ncbi:MAG: helix-turn-helix domain-containing protein [Jatrophihabitans sp.]|uniref:helix-turn-helix domain-containing protein n=1 Tax=Jatrophihabitans sp. TaxID=1932789 RepID=UPI003F7D0F9A
MFPDASVFAKALGQRLRTVRMQQHLSLHGVERKSGGRWKAVVVGSYERGDRAISVQRLAELADFYGIPVTDLLPGDGRSDGGEHKTPLNRVVLNLDRLHSLHDPSVEMLQRFARWVQRRRNMPTDAPTLSVRNGDLETLALMHDTTVPAITERLVRLQVLAPESVILDGEP